MYLSSPRKGYERPSRLIQPDAPAPAGMPGGGSRAGRIEVGRRVGNILDRMIEIFTSCRGTVDLAGISRVVLKRETSARRPWFQYLKMRIPCIYYRICLVLGNGNNGFNDGTVWKDATYLPMYTYVHTPDRSLVQRAQSAWGLGPYTLT